MRFVTPFVVCVFLAFPAYAENCNPTSLSPSALNLLKPLMELRVKQNEEQFTKDGHWRGESQYSVEVTRQFYSVLENHTVAGDEAVAYLLNVYMGEHPGEELVCEAINRGKRLFPLVKSFSECTPQIGIEPLPKFVRGSGVLPRYAVEGIAKGEKCEHH